MLPEILSFDSLPDADSLLLLDSLVPATDSFPPKDFDAVEVLLNLIHVDPVHLDLEPVLGRLELYRLGRDPNLGLQISGSNSNSNIVFTFYFERPFYVMFLMF